MGWLPLLPSLLAWALVMLVVCLGPTIVWHFLFNRD